MALPPVGSSTSMNVANGSFETAVKGDAATTKTTTGGAVDSASTDGSIKPGQGDFQDTNRYQIDEDLFE